MSASVGRVSVSKTRNLHARTAMAFPGCFHAIVERLTLSLRGDMTLV
jgi:hypothetical protein